MRRATGSTAWLVIALCLVAFVGVSGQAPKGKYGNADAISQDELKTYLYFLASDQLEGRNVPSRGYDTAALYIASHLKQWGVKPGGSAEGTDGPLQSYFMPIELVSSQADAAGMKLTLTLPPAAAGAGGGGRGGFGGGGALPPGPRSFDFQREWTMGGGGGRGGGAAVPALDIADARLVFVGHGYVIPKTNTDPYKDIDVKGKILVVAGQPAELAAAAAAAAAAAQAGGRGGAGGGRGAGAANPLGVDGTDFVSPQAYALKNGAAGIITVPTYQQLSTMAVPVAGRAMGPNGPAFQVVKFRTVQPTVPALTAGIALTNAIFQGEKITGAQAFAGAASNAKLDSFELNAAKTIAIKTTVTTEPGHTENVIGMVEGGDPVLKNEYVVFSAHLDHVGLSNAAADGDAINNGADDDGSGSAALMAIARAYAQGAAKGIKPKRTMIFLWVTGEEKGLWGSQYFNQFPPVDITKVVADLNMDMIGRSKTPGYVDPPQYKLVEPGEVLVVGPTISSDDMKKVVEKVAASYGKLKINYFYDTTAPDATHDNLGPQPNGQRIFYRSDHYNFAKNGIPVAFYTTGLHPDYHRVTDSPEKIDYPSMQAIARNVAAVGWEFGNGPRPKLNAKLPDQLVNDMKTAQTAGWGKLTPVLPPLPKMPF